MPSFHETRDECLCREVLIQCEVSNWGMTLKEALWHIWRSSRAVNYHIISCSLTLNPCFIHLSGRPCSSMWVLLCHTNASKHKPGNSFSSFVIIKLKHSILRSPYLKKCVPNIRQSSCVVVLLQIKITNITKANLTLQSTMVLQVTGRCWLSSYKSTLYKQPGLISCRAFSVTHICHNACYLNKSLTFTARSPIRS